MGWDPLRSQACASARVTPGQAAGKVQAGRRAAPHPGQPLEPGHLTQVPCSLLQPHPLSLSLPLSSCPRPLVSVSPKAKVTEECSQYEFENYMRQQLLLAEEKSSIHEARSWGPKRQFGSVPPVRRLGHDAQPMNPLDAAILAQRYLRK